MKNSKTIEIDISKEIEGLVYNINEYYTRKQNKAKMLFFKCLQENQPKEYFNEELSKIWGNIDHKFMNKQIEKLQELVHDKNVKEIINIKRLFADERDFEDFKDWIVDKEYFKLTPEEYFKKFENKYMEHLKKDYVTSKKTYNSKTTDKETYITKKIDTYNKTNNQIVSYFDKKGNMIRQVQLSSYLSMVHNTNLTRAGWNQTIGDSEYLDMDTFIIPFHPFSCGECYSYQNRPLSKEEVIRKIGDTATDSQGDLLHPNCKCTLSIYWDESQIQTPKYDDIQNEELYKLKQKVNRLTLERVNLFTDRRIAKANDLPRDKINKRIRAINKAINEIKEEMPTSSLKKQITSIKR